MPPSANPLMHATEYYRRMAVIRRFEETLLAEFQRGVFSGTTHTCLGQEANAVGIISQLGAEDILFSNHRCHGHFLAYGGSPRALFAELMGKQTGVCGGRGGSQHLQWRNFYSNGVQGGILPPATGMALAEKWKGTGAIACAFLGDGTLGEGALYEALNMASLWEAPILYVVENNHIAQTTPIEQAVAGSITGRFSAFGIAVAELESADVMQVAALAAQVIENIRLLQRPAALVLDTHRFGPHSKGDDPRSAEEVARLRQAYDPLRVAAAWLPEGERQQVEGEIETEIRAAFQQALADPFPGVEGNQ